MKLSIEFYFDFGSPSFFVGDELFFGKDRLDDVEREYLSVTGA